MGRLVFDHYFAEEFIRALDLSDKNGINLLEAERSVFGMDHADVGRMIAQKWNFPPQVAEAIGLHHRPDDAQISSALAQLVCVGNGLSRICEERAADAGDGDDDGARGGHVPGGRRS